MGLAYVLSAGGLRLFNLALIKKKHSALPFFQNTMCFRQHLATFLNGIMYFKTAISHVVFSVHT